MTTPVLKVKIFPKTVVKGKMDVRFPANVTASGGIVLTRTGGNYNFSFDSSGLVLAPPSASGSLGAVTALTPITHQFMTGIDTSGHPLTGRPDASDNTYTSSAPNAIATTANSKLDRVYHVSDWGVKGDGTDETAKLQAAFDNCPLGAVLQGYADSYIKVSANGLQCLWLSRSVKLRNIKIQVDNTLSNSVDILAIKPMTGNWYAWSMVDCAIGHPSVGRYGRHGIHIYNDATTQNLYSAVFDRLFILNGFAANGNAIYQENSGDVQGGMSGTIIRDSLLYGGVTLVQTGDRNTIQNCQMLPNAGVNGNLVDLDFVSGAMNFQFIHNNCGSVSLYFRSGLFPYIAYNTFEQTTQGFQPNNAVIDFHGVNSQIDAPVVENNVMTMLTAVSPSALVRFHNVKNGKFKGGNRFNMSTNAIPIIVTSTAVGTFISRNQEANTNTAAWVSGTSFVAGHEKPSNTRTVGDTNTTIDADGSSYPTGVDHTIATTATLSADRTWTLPPLSHCFTGEKFVIKDLAYGIGAHKLTISAQGADVFEGTGAATFDLVRAGVKAEVTAFPGVGVWGIELAMSSVVNGPASAVSGDIATFNGTSGKVIQDSGKTLPAGAIVGTTDAQTLTNKTIDTAGPNTLKVAGIDISTAWTAFSPSVGAGSGALTSASATGTYKQIGKLVACRVKVTITTNGTGASYISFSLPVPPNNSSRYFNVGLDNSNGTTLLCYTDNSVSAGSGLLFILSGGGYPGHNGAELHTTLVYEAA